MDDMITIDVATEQDLDVLVALNAEVQNFHSDAMPQRFKVADVEVIKACFEEWMTDEDRALILAKIDGEAVGYTVLKVRHTPEHAFCYEERSLEVDHIGVAKKFRRCGVGKALVDDAKARAKDLGIDDLRLTVWYFNPNARDFFSSQGFQPARLAMSMAV